jgi:hypothetical protein
MQNSTPQVHESKTSQCRRQVLRGTWIAACLLAAATFLAVAQDTPSGATLRPWEPADANRVPDKNDQMQMRQQQQQEKQASYAAANLERKRQIAADAAKLLDLATELKKEVDKADKETLSINVIRKAEMIEKLAKGVKEKMKLTAGAS